MATARLRSIKHATDKHMCYALYHANPQNHHINPLQKYKKVNWSKDRDRSGQHASRPSCVDLQITMFHPDFT